MSKENEIKELIADHLGLLSDDVEDTHHIKDDLGADSLDIMEMIVMMEVDFDIELDEDDFVNLSTVEQVVNHVEGVIKNG